MQRASKCPSDVVVPVVHVSHLVLAATVSPSASSSPPSLADAVVSTWLRALRPKVDGPQLAPLTGPDAERGHDCRAHGLQGPPEEM